MSNLILTRRPGECVYLGDDIAVTVLGVKGNQVRLGFNAPAEVSVDREEIWLRKRQEKIPQRSAAIQPPQPKPQIAATTNTLKLKARQ